MTSGGCLLNVSQIGTDFVPYRQGLVKGDVITHRSMSQWATHQDSRENRVRSYEQTSFCTESSRAGAPRLRKRDCGYGGPSIETEVEVPPSSPGCWLPENRQAPFTLWASVTSFSNTGLQTTPAPTLPPFPFSHSPSPVLREPESSRQGRMKRRTRAGGGANPSYPSFSAAGVSG